MKTSTLIQGCMTWGAWGKQLTTTQMARKMEDVLEAGVYTFDHADIYGGYTTEAEFGKAFVESRLSRESIQLISKCGIQLPDDTRGNRVKHYRYDAGYIKSQAEASISNLKADYLDMFLLHRPSPLMNFEDIAQAIDDLKREGKVKHFGVSNFSVKQIELLNQYVPVETSQIQCSLTHCSPLLDETFPYYERQLVLPMAWSPLGALHHQNLPHQFDKVLKEIEARYGCTRGQLGIAFLKKHSVGIVPVVGTTQTSRLISLLNATELNLSLQDWFLLLESSREKEVD